MTKIVLAGTYPKGTLEGFKERLSGEDVEIVAVDNPEAYAAMTDANIIILRVFKAYKDTIERNKNLKAICRWGAGVDSVDVEFATSRGIYVTNAPGANAYAVSDLAVLLMLAVGRNLLFHENTIQSGKWSKGMFVDNAITLNAKTVGLIGGGNIGRQVARKVQAFGARVQYFDVFRLKPEMEAEFNMKFVSLDELLKTSDVVSIHVPLTEENRHMINAEKIAMMKDGAIVINAARGGLIDDKALAKAIDEGHLMGAGLDCVEDEPLPAGHPLLGHPNIILTPHIGGTVSDMGASMIPMIGDNLKRFLHGEKLLYTVNEIA